MKIAIFLRGHARTWNFIKKDTIKFFNDLYDNPDWYVAMWNTTTTTTNKLIEDFGESKYVFISADIDEKFVEDSFDENIKTLNGYTNFKRHAYLKLSYLDFILNSEKKRHELNDNFRYDFVSFIRPDNFYLLGDSVHYDKKFAKSPILTTGVENVLSVAPWWFDGSSMANDFFMRAGNAAANVFCSRFFDTTYTDGKDMLYDYCPHNLLSRLILRNDLFDPIKGDMFNYIIRPDYESQIVDTLISSDVFKYAHNWGRLLSIGSVDIAMLYCIKNGIDIKDYQLNHNDEVSLTILNTFKNYVPIQK
jgi:hypothetical protein